MLVYYVNYDDFNTIGLGKYKFESVKINLRCSDCLWIVPGTVDFSL